MVLTYLLDQAGFCSIERVGSFNLFRDTSETVYLGERISLNVAAKKCDKEGAAGREGFEINHNASPYRE